jgi:hypothetical protein
LSRNICQYVLTTLQYTQEEIDELMIPATSGLRDCLANYGLLRVSYGKLDYMLALAYILKGIMIGYVDETRTVAEGWDRL